MKPELVAPAGDLEHLRIALLFGADAVYVGGAEFSLRARASNFTLDDIAEGVRFAHGLGKKVYAAVNVIPTDDDATGLDMYLAGLAKAGVDAVIASSPVVLDRTLALTDLPVHLSTQQSVASSAAAEFWRSAGAMRIVLARELSLAELRAIRNNTSVGLEVFVHGGMCASYAGRCTISNYLADRDANRGGCAHSCRWKYRLLSDGIPVSDRFDFSLAAKDLEALDYVPALADAGIDALKIEGRMKSANYVAVTSRVYRAVIDDHRKGTLKPWDTYRDELAKAENRPAADGFLGGITSARHQLYEGIPPPRQDFLGHVASIDGSGRARITLRNPVALGDTIEMTPPGAPNSRFTVEGLFDGTGFPLSSARRTGEIVMIPVPQGTVQYAMLRKVN